MNNDNRPKMSAVKNEPSVGFSPETVIAAEHIFASTRKMRTAISCVFGGLSGYQWWLLAIRAGTLTNPQVGMVVALAAVSGAISGYGWSTLGVEFSTNRLAEKYLSLLQQAK
jgi:hypothetical protein